MRARSPAHRAFEEALYDLSVAFSARLPGSAWIEGKGRGILIVIDDGLIIRIVFEDTVIQPLRKKLRGTSIAPRRQIRPVSDVLGCHTVPGHCLPRLLADCLEHEHPAMRLFPANVARIAQMTVRTGRGHMGLGPDLRLGKGELRIACFLHFL